jgi:hypothetical protein
MSSNIYRSRLAVWDLPPEAAKMCSASASLPGSGAPTAVFCARAAPHASITTANTA